MDWAEQGIQEAKAVRARLEKQSPGAGRRNFAGMLNALVSESASREMPGLAALEGIRKAQRLGYKMAADHNRTHAKFERAAAESFNRLYPRNKLASAAVAADRVGPDDARSERYTPDLEAKRLLDAAGRLASDPRTTRDHWSDGQPEAIAAEWLLTAARALVAAERERQVQEAAHDMASGRIPLSGRR
jgi:hypothetical protein